MNLTVELTTDQVIRFVQQMPPEEKRAVLFALAEQSQKEREARLDKAEAQLRRLAADRGLDWETMTEEKREMFIDDLVHEDRPCEM